MLQVFKNCKYLLNDINIIPWISYSQVSLLNNIWDKVFKNGRSEIYGRQPLKKLKWCGLLRKTISLQFFKGHLPQISLGPFLNTFFHFFFFFTCLILCQRLVSHITQVLMDIEEVMHLKNQRNCTCIIIFKHKTKHATILFDLLASPRYDVVLKYCI